jgi:hypothetical protein
MTVMEIITALAPCYKASAAIYSLITLATEETGTSYGVYRNKAIALLTLHWLALQERGRGGATGQITSETEGDLSRSYAATAVASGSSGEALMATSWGQELKRLRKTAGMMGMRTKMDFYGGC